MRVGQAGLSVLSEMDRSLDRPKSVGASEQSRSNFVLSGVSSFPIRKSLNTPEPGQNMVPSNNVEGRNFPYATFPASVHPTSALACP